MTNKIIKVEGMSCQHCVKAVEMELKLLEVSSYNVEIGKVELEFDENNTTDKQIEDAIVEAGFNVVKQ